jgi:hypothetical protein
MSNESSIETFLRFAQDPNWLKSSKTILAGDLFSMHNESNLFLNPDYYEIKDGKLWHRERGFLEGSASIASSVEENVITQLQDWFLSHDSGIAVQISPRMKPNPRHPGYPEEQITIYRIAHKSSDPKNIFDTKKILFFTSHQFKAKFKNTDEIRKFIFTEEDKEESVLAILEWLKNISEKPVQTELQDVEIRQKQAEYYAEAILSGVPIYQIAKEMDKTKFLGDNPIGCPASSQTQSFDYYSNTTETPLYSSTQTEWHLGICRKCGNTKNVGGCNICQSCVDLYYS